MSSYFARVKIYGCGGSVWRGSTASEEAESRNLRESITEIIVDCKYSRDFRLESSQL